MKRVLVAPLDWGLGHATRCIPIIRELSRRNCFVLVAGSGDSLLLLQNEFPNLTYATLPGYAPVYPSGGNMVAKLLLQIPKFISAIRTEHSRTNQIARSNKIDLIISDNRYGCWSPHVPSIFITHQLNILMPRKLRWLSKAVNYFNKKLIKKFSLCWVPDYPDKATNLSGSLSEVDRDMFDGIVYIGPLSRLNHAPDCSTKYDVACIISGPEPQRTIFEEKLIGQLRHSSLKYFVARGVVAHGTSAASNEANFLDSKAIEGIILQSSVVIARSGYSTIMDLAMLRKKGIVVPTPGQTEQEYLAQRWSKRGVLYSVPQDRFNLDIAWNESNRFSGFTNEYGDSDEYLNRELDRILKD